MMERFVPALALAVLTMATSAGCGAHQVTVVPGVKSGEAVKLARIAASQRNQRDALGWYEKILSTPGVLDADRREALRAVAILRMSPDPAYRDLGKSQALLAELSTMPPESRPTRDRTYEAQYLLAILEERTRAEAETASRGTELAQAAAASAAMNQSVTDLRRQVADAEQLKTELARLQAQEQTLRREADSLRARSSQLETALAAARAEVEQKDAALRRVAARLAGMRKPG